MTQFSTASDYAKDTWLPGFNGQLEKAKGTLLGMLGSVARAADRIEGRRAYIKLKTGDSLGQGTLVQGGDFPAPGDFEADEAILECAHLAHSIRWTDEEMVYLDSMNAAATPIMQEKMTSAQEAMDRDIQRQALGDGSGVLAITAGVPSGTTFTLSATATSQVDRDRYSWLDDALRMRFDSVDPATGAQLVTGFVATNINETTNVVTTDKTQTATVAGSRIVRSGDWASGGVYRSLEFDGLQAMIDDDNIYQGIDRTAAGKGYWKAVVLHNSGTNRAVTFDLVHQLTNRLARRRSDGKQPRGTDYVAFANSGSWSAYHNLLTPNLRYALGDTPDLGWGQPINFRGNALYEDIHVPRNGYMLIHKPSVTFVKPKHEGNLSGSLMKFLERNGSIFFQGNAAVGQGHSAKVFSYLNGFLGMATRRPRNHGWLRDITEVSV